MATLANITGKIEYKNQDALTAAITRLKKGNWLENGVWSDTGEQLKLEGLTLVIEFGMYTNLSRMFDKNDDTLLLGANSYEIKIDFDGEYLQEIYSDENGMYQSIEMERATYLHLLGYSKKEIEQAERSGEMGWIYEKMEDAAEDGFRHLLKSKAA